MRRRLTYLNSASITAGNVHDKRVELGGPPPNTEWDIEYIAIGDGEWKNGPDGTLAIVGAGGNKGNYAHFGLNTPGITPVAVALADGLVICQVDHFPASTQYSPNTPIRVLNGESLYMNIRLGNATAGTVEVIFKAFVQIDEIISEVSAPSATTPQSLSRVPGT